MPRRILDISPAISARLAVYPGDVPFQLTPSHRFARGDAFELSSIQTTLHLGAHADAPSHSHRGGASIDACPLEFFFGSCQVVAIAPACGLRLRPEHLPAEIGAPRVLFKTGTYPDPEAGRAGYASLTPELVEALATRRVCLVGIDTPSVDPPGDERLAAHRALGAHGMVNLEGLVLAHVPEGFYTLAALPLRLVGAEASPVRAVLFTSDRGGDFPA
jgi:arylformamidase